MLFLWPTVVRDWSQKPLDAGKQQVQKGDAFLDLYWLRGQDLKAFLEGCCASPTVENLRDRVGEPRSDGCQRLATFAPDGYRMATESRWVRNATGERSRAAPRSPRSAVAKFQNHDDAEALLTERNGPVGSRWQPNVWFPDSIAGGNGIITLEVATGSLISQLAIGSSVTIAITQP